MAGSVYISVIVPLRIDWEPVYALPWGESVCLGDRVKVAFAGKEYVGVVSGVDVPLSTAAEKVKPLGEVLGLPRVQEVEIRLWRKIAEYYLCCVGEVYKMAYPVQREVAADWKRIGVLSERIEKRREQLSRSRRDSVKERLEGEIASLEKEVLLLKGEDAESSQKEPHGEAGEILLTEAQKAALGEIKQGFTSGKTVLLQGVTGSGKTEIYSLLAREVLSRGKNVLYLVPEIALSRQLEERLGGYFPGALLCYHSGLSPAQKQGVMKALTGPYILLGTRSSLFLPHRNLGLVIVDEEHDTSYKQDSPAPYYNGRDVALMLAREHGAPALLGSATPSFESLYNCACGRFALVSLSQRYHGDAPVRTVIIDTVAERKKRGMVGSISRKLIQIIKDTLSGGGQAMVLRARKSYATTIQCSECGTIIRCPHCNVSLNYQKSKGRIVCNHCGYSALWSDHIPHYRPKIGPAAAAPVTAKTTAGTAQTAAPGVAETKATLVPCNGLLTAFGSGTEKIEEELAAIFPDRRVERLDSESSTRAGWQKKVLGDFASGKIDILVGTQILTKGFDFDSLSLVAVVQADSILAQQDFRADEKALQLLEQFRGRCSRRGQGGTFVLQTAQPDHPVYRMLLSENSENDVEDDAPSDENGTQETPQAATDYKRAIMAERKEFHYPPYSRIVNIVLRDDKPERLERLGGLLSLTLRGEGVFPGSGVEVSPLYAPAVDKVRDEYVRVVRVSFPKDRVLSENKAALLQRVKAFAAERKYDAHIKIDVDPI